MEAISALDLFQGIATLAAAEPKILFGRIFLILLGFALVYLGARNVLEPLLMIPMGLGMSSVNAGVMFLEGGKVGTLFVDPLLSEPGELMNILQIDWLQPIYTFTFSNGLIACFVFMGIGVLLDVGYVMARPFQSMFLALFAELGTIAVFPIAVALGLTEKEAAAVATIGGADGPMVLFTSLMLAKHLFVPITVVGYLYLGLTYGGYPYLIKWLVPKRLRGISMAADKGRTVSRAQKLTFAVVACTVLCLLFPVAAPLFLSLFVGVAVRESGIDEFTKLIGDTFLYGATFFLGLTLGVLCEANTILDPTVLKLLARRLHPVFLVSRQVQPHHRHRRRELRSHDGEGGAEDRFGGIAGSDDSAACVGRQHQRRHHHRHHRGRVCGDAEVGRPDVGPAPAALDATLCCGCCGFVDRVKRSGPDIQFAGCAGFAMQGELQDARHHPPIGRKARRRAAGRRSGPHRWPARQGQAHGPRAHRTAA
ncbi:MAG: sodium ion-translocating decarboxylase, beta subunit [Proteobacteria bacterium]|nr:sodium ion-translocating decarboxylase, beta subunit [Pseudomonadota bacterium]